MNRHNIKNDEIIKYECNNLMYNYSESVNINHYKGDK